MHKNIVREVEIGIYNDQRKKNLDEKGMGSYHSIMFVERDVTRSYLWEHICIIMGKIYNEKYLK